MGSLASVCVMIPTYNQAAAVVMAVKSALQQDYPNLEILVADDCSTDDTEAVLASYISEGKIQYFKNTRNIGRVANYHRCLYEYATADWVLNLDGDDYFTNTAYISQAMQAIEKVGSNNVLFYQGVNIYKVGERETIYPTAVKGELHLTAKDYFFRFIRLRHFSHMSALYHRHSAMHSGFYDKNVLSADIYSFLLSALNNPDKIVILSDNISGVWLQHEKNASNSVQLKLHWRNYQLYYALCISAMQKGYSKIKCTCWWIGMFMPSLRSYAATVVRSWWRR